MEPRIELHLCLGPESLANLFASHQAALVFNQEREQRSRLRREPRLVRVSWDWDGGDFERGLGAAGHSGRPDIAGLLLDRGAPIEPCAAATLGYLEIIQSALEARPSLLDVAGPHGIPLIARARAGGKAASKTLACLVEFERRMTDSD